MGLSNSSGWVWEEPSQDVENETGNDLYPDPSGLLSLAAPITVAAISGANAVQVNGGIFNTIGHATVNNYYRTMPRDEADRMVKLLDWLTEVNFRAYHNETLDRRTPGTGERFLKGEPFQIWKDRPGAVLWGIGMPGAGKTYLASTVVEHLEALAREAPYGSISVAFIYCRYTDQIPVRDILAALVRQLLERNHSLLYLVEPLFERHSLERTQPTQHELLDVLANISDVVKTNFFVLDGLDEALDDAQFDLLEALASLNANTFITSRPLQQLEAQAEEWSTVEFFNVTATEEDLNLFLNHRISRSASMQRLLSDQSFRDQVLSEIRHKSDGMFLHASLHVETLHNCLNKKDVENMLAELPTGIEGLYAATLTRVEALPKPHRDLAMRVLLWLVFAHRSMSVEEMQYATAACLETQAIDPARLVSEDTLVSACCGLVTVSHRSGVRHPISQYESGYRIIRLIHYTAKDALKPAVLNHFPDPHGTLAQVCIAHLLSRNLHKSDFKSEDDLMDAFDENPLLAYAYYAWSYHAHRCSARIRSTAVLDFISRCTSFPSTPFERGSCDGESLDQLTALHVAARYGFPEIFSGETGLSCNIGTVPLRRTPLMLASCHGHEVVVQDLLVKSGVDVNASDEVGWSALMFASEKGFTVIVKLLLAIPNIQFNARSNAGSTALILAADEGHIEVVNLLLECPGIQINMADDEGMTAISYACQNDHGAIVRRLIRAPGIRAGVKDDWWRYVDL